MAYTSSAGYKNDVFISYAHADDLALLGSSSGWVSNFIDDLKIQLDQKLGTKKGETPFVWKDENLAKNIPLSTALQTEIEQTATYLIIMSPAYLVSDWCTDERKKFVKILKEKGVDTRMFIVATDIIDRNKYPEELNNEIKSYDFFSKVNDKFSRKLGVPDRQKDDGYYPKLLDVSTDLANELIRIREKVENEPEKGYAYENEKCIFLAQATDDLDDKREELSRYLIDMGYKILPEENIYRNEKSLVIKGKILENLKQSLLYVQLLSDLPGKKIADSPDKLAKFQFDIAQRSQVKKLIWRPSDVDTDKVADLDFKRILESEYVRTGGFEEFKIAVSTGAIPPPPPPRLSHPNSKLVYICTDSSDKDYQNTILEAIQNRVPKKNKIDCFFPLDNSSSNDPRKYNEESILGSDAALFVYCKSDPGTVLNQLRYCLKTSVRRESPFEIVGIYDGPPIEKVKIPISIESENFVYLDCRTSPKDFTEKFLNVL